MDWDALLLFLAGVYATLKTSQLAYQLQSLKFLAFALAAFSFCLGQGSFLVSELLSGTAYSFNTTVWIDFSTILSISFVLCALAVLIRESKPVFAQFPLIYAGVPLLLVISYWLVKDSFAIKEWLISIYQGGALLVAILMYSTHSFRYSYNFYLLGATLLLLVTYVLYWFIPGITENFSWIWQLSLAMGVIGLAKGFDISSKINAEALNQPD